MNEYFESFLQLKCPITL